MVCCRLSMPVEFHSGPRKITDINEVIAEDQRAKKDDGGKIHYGSITKVKNYNSWYLTLLMLTNVYLYFENNKITLLLYSFYS